MKAPDDPLVPPRHARASPRPRPRRCSSRRGRRDRRRSSCSARSTAASGCPDRATPRGRAACTPRSRRPPRPAAADVASGADERCGLRRDLVGVDLIAEQQQAVGPRLRRPAGAGASTPRARRPRTPPDARPGDSVYGGRCGRADPARAEHEPCLPLVLRACGSRVGGRPSSGGQTRSPSRRTSYGVTDAGLEPVDQHERVVVALHVERSLAVPEHRHLCTATGLDPHRRPWSFPTYRSSGPTSELVLRRGDRHGSRS